MALVIILVAAVIFGIIVGIVEWPEDGVFAWFVASVIGFFLWVGIGGIVWCSPAYESPVMTEKIEIVSLADGNLLEGRFGFLGQGYIDEELKYTFVHEGDYGYTTTQIKAKNCFVNYTTETPYAIPIKQKWGWFGRFWGVGNEKTIGYVFYLPEGSIIEQFNIDLS